MDKQYAGGVISPEYNNLKSLLYDKFKNFFDFFTHSRWESLIKIIHLALIEDGKDLTTNGIFNKYDEIRTCIVVKEESISSCLPLIDIVLNCISTKNRVNYLKKEGEKTKKGEKIAILSGPARDILKAERVILNFLSHTFGVSYYTHLFVKKIKKHNVKILDTRKTIPGMRYIDKYAVLVGGGKNHRMNLSDMLMLKDNHIDRAGSIKLAVESLKNKYKFSCPPIIVECRNLTEVIEAVEAEVDRILLDNMELDEIKKCVKYIPEKIEIEVSGGIDLNNVEKYAIKGIDYISVGKITKDAPCIDLSMMVL